MRRKKGFTLLELIIVVIVIGILASIALPRYIRIAEKGRVAEAKAALGNLRSAQLRYANQWSVYTTSGAALDIQSTASRYYSYAVLAGSITNDATIVASATRNTFENPLGYAYVINMTAGGNITTNATDPIL